MIITRVTVSGLFDRFDHDIIFKSDEPIIIMTGPNGFGKTTILRLVNTLFNKPVRTLSGMPFRTLVIYFDDGSDLTVSKRSGQLSRDRALEVTYHEPSKAELLFQPQLNIDSRNLGIPLSSIEDFVPELDQIDSRLWRDISTDSLLDVDEVLEKYGPQLPWEGEVPEVSIPDWLADIREKISVRYIDTERLTPIPELSSRNEFRSRRIPTRWRAEGTQGTRTVRRYSEELGRRVQETLSEYGSRAQSLDRTFPVRLVEEPSQTDVTMEHLRKDLAEVEAKRVSLVNAGLLAQEHEGLEVPALEEIDESRRGVLAVYARDAKEKLSIFDKLYLRIDAFKRISNARLLYKEVTVGGDGLSVSSESGESLDLEMLSSGEQHELVILYELLFRVPDNSFILFDEPELSLHVEWQDMFLDDLEEMAKISRFHVLLATHSPQIIGDRWDLTVELRGSNQK